MEGDQMLVTQPGYKTHLFEDVSFSSCLEGYFYSWFGYKVRSPLKYELNNWILSKIIPGNFLDSNDILHFFLKNKLWSYSGIFLKSPFPKVKEMVELGPWESD